MCGILGIWAKNGIGKAQLPKLPHALKLLLHRGPDHHSCKLYSMAGLAHARLSIIDTSVQANQPFMDPTGRYSIVFNGEIFNFKELRESLSQKGIDFRTNSDTEVLLYLFIDRGVEVLTQLNGFFAFCIYDKQEHTMFLARDRYGVKPLLYVDDDDKFIFSSELNALLRFDINRSVDQQALHHYFSLTYIPAPSSIFKHVKVLEPGCWIQLNDRETKYGRYFQNTVSTAGSPTDYGESSRELESLMDRSVESRLIADVPVGCFLSGGLDSSIVAAIAKDHKSDMQTFSMGFEHPYFDEKPFSDKVAKFLGTRHQHFQLDKQDFRKSFPEFLSSVTEPFGDSSAFALWMLAGKARESVKVCLSGDGADEVFGGYRKHQAERTLRKVKGVKAGAIRIASGLLSGSHQGRDSAFGDFNRKLQKFREGMGMSDSERYWNWCTFISDTERQELLADSNPSAMNLFENRDFSSLNQVLLCDQELVLPNDMLRKVDMASMAHGLEVRTPFLDFRVVEFANQLPEEFKITYNDTKKILRQTFVKRLPAHVVKRKKSGFEIPLKLWLETEIQNCFDAPEWSEDFIRAQGLFNPDKILKIRSNWKNEISNDHLYLAWSLLIFQYWWARWVVNP